MNKKEILISCDYLVLPVSAHVENRNLLFYQKGILADDITVRLDYVSPEYNVYYPVSKWKGEAIEIEILQGIEFIDMQTDTPDYSYTENYPFRPAIHFTVRSGWHNDPNGLVEYTSPVTGEKTWHMFFQYNPYSRFWGNMHWGHATSKDLFHWEQQEIALYPDEKGTIFSGSAIIDRENRSGLKEGDEDVMLLFYTAAGSENVLSKGTKYTQCMAYSTDGGKTFRKYEKNPVVNHIVNGNRDPKVIWCEEMQCYIMALYLDNGVFTILTSQNFTQWERLQDIDLEGDGECPDIYPLYAENDPNDRKWVIMGASSRYFVMECTKHGFEVIQEVKPLRCGNFSIYASQTFSDVSDGRRINIAWNNEGFTFPNAPFASQMGVPVKMALKKNNSSYYVCVEPVEELLQLAEKTENYENLLLKEENCFALELAPKPYYVTITGQEQTAGKISMRVFGCPVEIDMKNNVIRYKELMCPLSVMGECFGLKMIVDKRSIEFITEDGAAIMTIPVLCDYNISKLEMTSDKDMVIERMTVTRLQEVFH